MWGTCASKMNSIRPSRHIEINVTGSTGRCLYNDVFYVPCVGDEMTIANFCSGSKTTFSTTASSLPGQNVTIICSVPDTIVIWNSPQFNLGSLVLSDNPALGTYSGERLDGAVVFTLTNVTAGSSPCYTATATIANIQESMQGVTLTCTDAVNLAIVTFDVIGKFHVICKF